MLKAQKSPHAPGRSRVGVAALVSLLVVAGLVVGVVAGPASAAEPFQIVVHESNPVSSLTALEVSKMFLKKIGRWEGGTRVLPVDLVETSAVRRGFSWQIHGKDTSAVKAYWQRMIFSGRDVPPPEKSSVQDVLDYVREHEGAIGYVPAGTSLGEGIKSVKVRQ